LVYIFCGWKANLRCAIGVTSKGKIEDLVSGTAASWSAGILKSCELVFLEDVRWVVVAVSAGISVGSTIVVENSEHIFLVNCTKEKGCRKWTRSSKQTG
jgi:hypothetical protein